MANKVLEILIKLAKSGTGAADAARDINAIDTSTGNARKGLRDTEQAADKTGTAFKKLGSKIKSMGSSFLNTFKKLKLEALAFAGILAGSVREAVVNNINIARAWTMSSTMGFKEMRTEVRGLSMELGVAKDKISSGLYQALSAGVPEDNVFSFLKTASKVAVADGSEVSVAVDGITTVLNAFKIEAEKTGEVADLMFQTVSNGKTTFSDLASNLSTVAPLAASTGIGIEQILAATATLTKQGTPTAQAMTQIRASIIALNEELGDGWSKTYTYQEAVTELSKRAAGSQQEISKMVGSVDALGAILGLTGINAAMATQDLNDLGNSTGALDAAYEKVDKFRHWSKLWEASRGFISRVGEAIDKEVAPAVEEVTEALKGWVADDEIFNWIGEKVKTLRDDFMAIFAAFKRGEGGEAIVAIFKDAGTALTDVLDEKLPALAEKFKASMVPDWAKTIGNIASFNARVFSNILTSPVVPKSQSANPEDPEDDLSPEPIPGAFQVFRDKWKEETEATARTIKDSSEQQALGAQLAREQVAQSAADISTSMSEAADAFAQGQQMARAQYEDATESTNAATEKLVEGAEAVSDTGEALNDAAEVIPAAADEATERIDNATEKTATDLDSAATTASQATADMSATLVASVRNFTDATSRGLGDAADNIDRSLSSFQSQIESINQRLSTIATVAANAEYEAQLANDRLRVMT
jgi:hypothetical protein